MTGNAHTRLIEGADLAAQLKALWAEGAISDITYKLVVRALYGAATEEAQL